MTRLGRIGGQRGLTLVEIMVSMAIVGIAAALIFGVQMRMSSALSDQQKIAEVQQTLRSSAAVLSKELRQAGYLANSVYATPWGIGGTNPVSAVVIYNKKNGVTDEIHMQAADDKCYAHVCDSAGKICPKSGPAFNASETEVSDNSCFHDGDIAYAVHVISPKLGEGCVLAITHDPQNNAAGQNQKIQHNPGQGTPWNQPGNTQCDDLKSVWNDGYTVFTRIRLRAYRIKPNDARGVLQVSPSGGNVANDWQDMALGIVNMQFAVRVWHCAANDYDKDGDAHRDWFSGDNMTDVISTLSALESSASNPTPQLQMVSLTLVAKTTKPVNGTLVSEVPTLIDTNFDTSDTVHQYNRLSDMGAVSVPSTDTTSMYYGDVVYRTFTTTIDLRNVGVNPDPKNICGS
jgi:prepilin-type N-terminal cleavage/methylation domain-containing protein